MEQYEQSGPTPEAKTKEQADFAGVITRLEQQVALQDRAIRELQQELRRVKQKLDRHADFLNRQQSG